MILKIYIVSENIFPGLIKFSSMELLKTIENKKKKSFFQSFFLKIFFKKKFRAFREFFFTFDRITIVFAL